MPAGGHSYVGIKVFFSTDRTMNQTITPKDMAGSERGEEKYGYCMVSIPPDHRMGELESPRWYKLEFKENPEKHVVVLEIKLKPKEDFFKEINSDYPDSGKTALIFVHGFNVCFVDAARRTAQMTYDLGFKGIPAFYSWPSQGTLTGYTVDADNIAWATPHIMQFFVDFIRESGVKSVVVIAHSMGNRGVVEAISRMNKEFPNERKIIKEVILAAPDIDAEVFKNDIAPRFLANGSHVTMYASSNDLAIKASKKVNGHQRLGDSSPKMTVCKGMESIDASDIETDFLGHSYFSDNASIISDMYYLINDPKKPNDRFMLVPSPDSLYWKFKKN
jgi:esterase/lipase superfamily enzyme